MKRGIFSVLLVIILICSAINAVATQHPYPDSLREKLQNPFSIKLHTLITELKENQKNVKTLVSPDNLFSFSPDPITLKDDAFYGSDNLHFTEWWYFDATLNDGYTMQIIYQIYSMVQQHFVVMKLNLYHHGEHIIKKEQVYLPHQVYFSTVTPRIILDNKEVLSATMNNDQFEYQLNLDFDSIHTEFTFTGCTPGWKGELPMSKWIVALPRAEVTGFIQVDQNTLQFTGVGYHDHNAEITAEVGLFFGWYWGKIHEQGVTITWSDIMPTSFDHHPLLVINTADDKVINVPEDNIKVSTEDLWFENGFLIPHKYTITAKTNDIDLHAFMRVEDIHHVKVGPIKYWRFHVHITGTLTIENSAIDIEEEEITEFIRFR